jgi:hypothetical protein
MKGRKMLGGAFRFRVHNEIDVPLPVLSHVLGTVPPYKAKAKPFKDIAERLCVGGRELDKFKAIGSHGVVGLHCAFSFLPAEAPPNR